MVWTAQGKHEMLERSVALTHVLLALPEDVRILDAELNHCNDKVVIHIDNVNAPAHDREEIDENATRYYKDMGDNVELLWIIFHEEEENDETVSE